MIKQLKIQKYLISFFSHIKYSEEKKGGKKNYIYGVKKRKIIQGLQKQTSN